MFFPLLLLLIFVSFSTAQQNFYFTPQYYGNQAGIFTTPFLLPQDDDTCQIRSGWTGQQKCQYVKENVDNCEGGGYLLWTHYVMCTQSVVGKVFTIIGAVIFLLVLFLHISTAADEFFSPNIAAIVAHLRISESIAGVTFCAFGNGAPDVFGSIASILSTPRPKADLALGALLGAGCFVTTCVLGTIIFYADSFRIHKFGVIRDLIFYLIAVGWILFVFLRGDTVLLYEPMVYLGIYLIYLVVVIGGTMLLNKYKKRRIHDGSSRRKHSSRRHSSKRQGSRAHSINSKRTNSVVENPRGPDVFIISDNVQKDTTSLKFADDVEEIEYEACNEQSEGSYVDDEEIDEEENQDVVVIHNHVYAREDAPLGEEDELPPTFSKAWKWSDIPKDLAIHLNPWPEAEEWNESGKFARFMYIIRVPSQVILKATIPRYEDGWSKPVALFYCLIAPQFVLFAVHMLTTSPFKGSPGLFVYGFAISAIVILLVILFTRMDTPPRYHKEVACYTGFILAVAWIYFTASEIVSIITMVGVLSGVSFEILGMTILAWSNSFGDFIADLAVVKQGFPRMAMAAATGGPLFTIFVQRFKTTKYHAIALFIVYGCFFVLAILCEAKVIVWQ